MELGIVALCDVKFGSHEIQGCYKCGVKKLYIYVHACMHVLMFIGNRSLLNMCVEAAYCGIYMDDFNDAYIDVYQSSLKFIA